MSAHSTNGQSALPVHVADEDDDFFDDEPTLDDLDVVELIIRLRGLLDGKPGGQHRDLEQAVLDGTLHYSDLDRALSLVLDRI